MQIIDAILELARSLEPIQEEGSSLPDFTLYRRRGRWFARVDMKHCYSLSDGDNGEGFDTADAALNYIFRQMEAQNKSLLNRIKDRLARWAGGKPILRAVKEK
jgi:hypothetical protein